MLKFAFGAFFLLVGVNSLTIPANDNRIYHTEYNWYADKTLGFIETANPGAYIKVDFTGSSIGISLAPPLLNTSYATLAWSIDQGPEQNTKLPVPGNFIQLASSLDQSRQHSLYLFVKNAIHEDRWFGPGVRIRILNFTIDDGATLIAPKLAPKRLLAYWDSIGEGVAVYGDIPSSDAHVTWAFSLALVMNVELSLVAWGSQGYTVGGTGNTPPLFNSDGQANSSAWKWLSSKYPRSFEVCPDYFICGHGTNDHFRNQTDQEVYASVLGWLQEVRKTCQNSQIFLIVPFGRFKEDAIVQAYQSYQAAQPDRETVLIQLEDRGSHGLTELRVKTFEAVDGLHPWAWKSCQLGALLAAEIVPHLNSNRLPLHLLEF